MTQPETHQFQAETQKLLNIIINSIYTNREIFLRELISNASDALDKVRFEQNRGSQIVEPEKDLEIRIDLDKTNRWITVSDTGIGMTKQEVVNNLGTIAQSGTEEFLKKVTENNENPDNIIGRFGVGFYSVFMVAEQVIIKSRSAFGEENPVQWHSKGLGEYEVQELEEDIGRGTQVEIGLQDGDQEFLDAERLKSIIRNHSNFISFPIYVDGEKVNTVPALWKQSKFQITQEQYDEFYKFLTYDTEGPLETIHVSVDAPVQFSALLFIPPRTTAMFDTYNEDYGLDLYVNRVLIQRRNQEVIPQYLGFLKGVVDSEDLPLNLSRETVQENTLIQKISSTLTKQVLNRLQEMAQKRPEDYATFWREHGKLFKLGYTDFGNRDKFAELLRFNSSVHDSAEELTSLQEYVDRMKTSQQEIYYISGSSREGILSNPHLELLRKKGIEVLFLYEPVDEFVLQAVGSYKDYPLKAAEHVNPGDLENIASEEESKEEQPELSQQEQSQLEEMLGRMKQRLGDSVTEVRRSQRLSESPACLVNPDGSMSSQMQKIMHMMQKDDSVPKQILEINPDHPLTRNMLSIYRNNPEDSFLDKATDQLFEAALLQTGYLPDPHSLVTRSFDILADASRWYTQANKLNL
ncbi:MAG: molecular chaperone HtpG [Desulfohalobiaceae bacterium]|nr:molecular chaperone HtpG [Desulfohalobiaceae bacterium]